MARNSRNLLQAQHHPQSLIAILALLLFAAPLFASSKTFDATYTATLSEIRSDAKSLDVWIPLPVTRGSQRVSNVVIASPHKWTRHTDALGNEYAFATIANPGPQVSIPVTFTVTRDEALVTKPRETKATKAELQRALKADRLVTLSPRVKQLAAELTKGQTTTMGKARAIYDHLLATMKYDKTIPGWGDGNTERACDVRAGNCTDFHSLFMSLARASGIPSRFVIGFPLSAADGNVTGYHCWAEFWVDGKGWIPVDASDASKTTDEKVRNYLFGNLDPDRVQFTVGRDLVLQPKTSEPLNYFIRPRGEVNGVPTGVPSIALKFKPAA